MKTLSLVRHAKAAQQFLNLEDIDRPLIDRGYNDAHVLSTKLKKNGVNPQIIISSTGIRAVSTALIFARNLQVPALKIQLYEKLYNALAGQIIDIIHELPVEFNHVMLFGHNPSITNCANMLINDFLEHVPTCGIVCIDFKADQWDNVKPRTGTLRFFDYPKNN